MKIAQVRIVGTGLIGTSIALGLAGRGIKVVLVDSDPENERLAQDLLSGSLGSGESDLTILATPPLSTFEALKKEFARNPDQRFIDTGSVKTKLLNEVEKLPELASRFLGTHPMAGRESGGARFAQGDLFQGRAWFLVPTKMTERDLVDDVSELVQDLGATTYEIGGEEHDRLLASISHLPQVISSSLASSIVSSPHLELAGQGLRDMVRIAGSDPMLWSEIFLSNKENVVASIDNFIESLTGFRQALADSNLGAIKSIFEQGALGRQKVSGKHGAQPRNYVQLLIVIEDKPGQLSQLFLECAEVRANIEDLSIEHSPGQETGLITLSFSPDDAARVAEHLRNRSWNVHQA